jgi:hypothetical protein
MSTERMARLAMNNVPRAVMRFDDFVGLGVVPEHKHSSNMVVAVYVARPPSKLPQSLLDVIPQYLPVDPNSQDKRGRVRTRIVNIGRPEP